MNKIAINHIGINIGKNDEREKNKQNKFYLEHFSKKTQFSLLFFAC